MLGNIETSMGFYRFLLSTRKFGTQFVTCTVGMGGGGEMCRNTRFVRAGLPAGFDSMSAFTDIFNHR